MEYFPSGLGAVRQLYPDTVPSNISTIGRHLLNHYCHITEEITCPEPRRIIGKQAPVETLNRLYSKQRSFVARPKWEAPDIMDIILSSSDDSEADLDSPRQLGFLCGSPPVRAGNPLVFDTKFEKEAPSLSPLSGCNEAEIIMAAKRNLVRETFLTPNSENSVLSTPTCADNHRSRQLAVSIPEHEKSVLSASMVNTLPSLGDHQSRRLAAPLLKPDRENSVLSQSKVERKGPPSTDGNGDSWKSVVAAAEDKRQLLSCAGKPRVRIEGFGSVSAMA
ncbi:uncharacterized protein LOC144704558 [Wolffia australiana]